MTRWAWIALAFAAAALMLLACSPVLDKVAIGLWAPRTPYPVTETEATLIAPWRSIDMQAPRPMLSTPFVVHTRHDAGALESIQIANLSPRPLRDFWFHREDMPNFYNAQTIIDSVTAGKQSQTEKVIALWELFPRYYYNYYPLSHAGPLNDPPTVLAAIGTAQCNYAAVVLETLCQMIGCETRTIGIQLDEGDVHVAHCTTEIKADGRWIFLDPDGHAAYRRADGEWASVQDLVADPSPILKGGHGYYKPEHFARAFSHGAILVHEHDQLSRTYGERQTDPAAYLPYHHTMRFDLPPGARLTLYPGRKGRTFGEDLPEAAFGTLRWTYQPEHFTRGVASGLASKNLIARIEEGHLVLERKRAGEPASLIVPMVSPYLMVAGRAHFEITSLGRPEAYLLPFNRCVLDEVEGWDRLGALEEEGTLAFDALLGRSPVFGYALKITVPPTGMTIRSLDVLTHLQSATKALPRMAPGDNTFILYAENRADVLSTEERAGRKEIIRFTNGLELALTHAQCAENGACKKD